jgi:low temperature requirement protein LtrA
MSEGQVEVGEQRVTPLELFFDLVFVFAITKSRLRARAPPARRGSCYLMTR